jgi:hypothetical protein
MFWAAICCKVFWTLYLYLNSLLATLTIVSFNILQKNPFLNANGGDFLYWSLIYFCGQLYSLI